MGGGASGRIGSGSSGSVGGGASGRSGGRESGRLGTDPLKLEASISNAFRGCGVSKISSIGAAGLCTASKPSRGRLSDLKLSSCSCSLFLVQSSFHCDVRNETFEESVCDLVGVLFRTGSTSSGGGGSSGIGGGGAGGSSSSSDSGTSFLPNGGKCFGCFEEGEL